MASVPETPIGPAERAAAAARSTWTSVVVNVVLSTVQIVVGWQTHSKALVADGLHSMSDLFADFVVLVANRHGRKDPDEDHPYGHQRFETAASLVLGLLLLSVAAGMLWSAVGHLGSGRRCPRCTWPRCGWPAAPWSRRRRCSATCSRWASACGRAC